MTLQENESKIKFEFLVILAPSPLILILILSVMGSKSLFCFRKSEICILNTVSTEVTLAPSNLAFSGSILHILFSSSRHCLTFTCGHQKRFTNGNVWTRINLKTDKYLSVFKFIRIRVDGALIGSLHLLLAGLSVLRLLLSSLQKGKQIMSNFV